jgi:hypothetical protein
MYLYAAPQWQKGRPFKRWQDVLRDLTSMLDREDPGQDYQAYLERCHVVLRAANSDTGTAAWVLKPSRQIVREGSLIDLTQAPDDTLLAQPFRIGRSTTVRIVAVGEVNREVEAGADRDESEAATYLHDYAWIEVAASGATAWQMKARNSIPAGGARKNCQFAGEVALEPGEYVLHYVTDASHAWKGWNSSPPPDPASWGVAVYAGNGFQPGDLQLITRSQLERNPSVLVKMLQVHDDEDRAQVFELTATSRLRLQVLGEGFGGEIFDYGWIVALDRDQRVWEMTWRETESGGGSSKNRLFTGEIELAAGRYEAHYVSDGSHAFRRWNAQPPREPHQWGMVITLVSSAPRQ